MTLVLGQRDLLTEYVGALDTAGSLDDVQVVMRSAPRRLVGAWGATFVLRDGDQCFYVDEDAASPLWKGQRFPIGTCISGWAMLHAETAAIPDIRVDERIPQEAYRPTFVRSLVMVPVGHPPVGAVGAYWGEVHRATHEERSVLERLAVAAGRAIDRIGLHGAPVAPVLRRP